MYILCTFRPADPGVEVLVARLPAEADESPPNVVGWLLTQLSPQTANYLLDCQRVLKLGNEEIRNVAVKLPQKMSLEMHTDHAALSDLWTATRELSTSNSNDHRLALLPSCEKTLAELTETPSLSDLRDQADIALDSSGAWLQIYDPALSLTFISCLWPWSLISTLAGQTGSPQTGTT